ncbi:hypothetical protein ONZ43_g6006 [Nemania bipapillata]|uniref:Uncharacterized protein n=1 Tax=Nemania bipapillata TaxID=110536 RepID=A0ACC2I4P2_9PEZI|nr:hypothetical protein ONZ43_g6006 [Nemania bipapillata]
MSPNSTFKELEKVDSLDTSDQWLRWSREMKEKLAMYGFGQLLPGGLQVLEPTLREGESAENFEARREKWFDKRDMACAAIRSKLSTNAYHRVQQPTLNTPALIWAELLKHYKPKGKAQFAQYYRQWEETTLETCGGVTQFAAALRQIQADMTELDANSAWPHSHVIRKFINGLGPDFDLFLTTWELSVTEIPVYNTAVPPVIIQAAVTLEEATDAAVRFEQGQKERASQTALLATKANLLSSSSSGNKRKRCSDCHKLHPGVCYTKHPELKPAGWDEEQQRKRAKWHERKLKELEEKTSTTAALPDRTVPSTPSVDHIMTDHTIFMAYTLTPPEQPSARAPVAPVQPGLLSSMFQGVTNLQGNPSQDKVTKEDISNPTMARKALNNIPKKSRLGELLTAVQVSQCSVIEKASQTYTMPLAPLP